MTRINRAYVKRLENLILQLDATFSDIETARAKGYLARDMPLLHKEADAIRASRQPRETRK
ncbi:hypothetical protein [Nitrobacter hamburgensis]|uniref:hypothetical protein n=1 Tax=Nitrobacter hamburgensis TaxID=912 RepID=UPI000313AE04|nr:hypothetical protein [Nitrobacter hamburgensis]